MENCEKYFVLANFLLTGWVSGINMFHMRNVFQGKHFKSVVVNIPVRQRLDAPLLQIKYISSEFILYICIYACY